MKAIILAAGVGSRMRPFTDTQPKAMLMVAGQTVIERMVRLLLARSITEICVVTGHCRSKLETYLKADFPEVRFTFVFNEAYQKTNNIFSMHLAFEEFLIDDDVLLIESDLVITGNILDCILDSPHQNVALVDKFRAGMDGTVVKLSDGLITNIIPPHQQGPGFDFSDKYKTLNIYKFSREFAQTSFRRLLSFYATTYNDNCYYELVLGILVYMQHERIYAIDVNGALWCELDDPNDVRIAEVAFNDNNRLETLDNAFGGLWNFSVTDFAFIRNMHFPSNSILSDMRYNMTALVHNYGSTQTILNGKLAYFLVVPRERICLLNGLSQIYPMLPAILGDRTALIPEPTFGEYSRAFPNRMTYQAARFQSIKDLPSSKVAAADIMVFVNPNNPTGLAIPSEEIMALARQKPDKLILVDESFADFSGQRSVQDLLQEDGLPNVWVLKSLSKCLGVPGMRLGYVYSRDQEAIKSLNEQIPVWNSNSLVEYFLESILKHRRTLAESFRSTIADREAFTEELRTVAAVEEVYPSSANFILVRLKLNAAQVQDLRIGLLNRWNCYVKDCSAKFDDGRAYMRIAVRLAAENTRFAQALESEGARIMGAPTVIKTPELYRRLPAA